MKRLPLTPGSKVKIISGSLKGAQKLVSITRNDRVFLKNALRDTQSKKAYEVNVHISNCKVLSRRANKVGKSDKTK